MHYGCKTIGLDAGKPGRSLTDRLLDNRGNLRKSERAVQKSIDSNLVGGIKDRWRCSARFQAVFRKFQRGKALLVGLFECQRASGGEIKTLEIGIEPGRPCEAVGYGRPHVGQARLGN